MTVPTRRDLSLAVLYLLETQTQTKTAQALANYLVVSRRTKELDMIIRDIESLRLAREGISEATAICAFELDH